jgi:hypothetical protein
MEKQSSPLQHPTGRRCAITLEAAVLIAALGLLSIAVFAGDGVPPSMITVSGQVHAAGEDLSDALLVVELNGGACLRTELDKKGRFRMEVPAEGLARIVLMKPGYLTKELFMDTHHAMRSTSARERNRSLRFDVVLEREADHPCEQHLVPAGYIAYATGTGALRIRHDERMVTREGSQCQQEP